jgi:hypothetical protein
MASVPDRSGKPRGKYNSNPEYIESMRQLRRSSATSPQETREDRKGSKTNRNRTAIRKSMEEND